MKIHAYQSSKTAFRYIRIQEQLQLVGHYPLGFRSMCGCTICSHKINKIMAVVWVGTSTFSHAHLSMLCCDDHPNEQTSIRLYVNCCLARMLPGEAELVSEWTGLPGEAKGVKRFERSNWLDTALYKNYLFWFERIYPALNCVHDFWHITFIIFMRGALASLWCLLTFFYRWVLF